MYEQINFTYVDPRYVCETSIFGRYRIDIFDVQPPSDFSLRQVWRKIQRIMDKEILELKNQSKTFMSNNSSTIFCLYFEEHFLKGVFGFDKGFWQMVKRDMYF